MAFESCEQINTLFIQGQQHIDRSLIKKKFIPTNAYHGKVPTGSFPIKSGMIQRGHRLERQAPPNCLDWRKLEQTTCETNTCDFDPEIIHNGSSTYYWYPVQLDLRTDWICLESLLFNEFPEEEVMHMEESLQNIDRYINEEFLRTHYTDACDRKWIGLLPADQGTPDPVCNDYICGAGASAEESMWLFERFDESGVSGIGGLFTEGPNSCRLRVAVGHSELERISGLSLDVLDHAVQYLEYEEGTYIMDNVQMFDLILPDVKTSRQLQRQEDAVTSGYKSTGGFDAATLNREMGIQRVVGNYATRYDRFSLRYAPLPIGEQPNGGVVVPSDPTTWTIMERVFPYNQSKAELGVKHAPNANFIKAPFAITNLFQPGVGRVETLGEKDSWGSAKSGQNIPDGTFTWRNPDWDCNIKRNKGFWLSTHRLAWHPRRTELGNSILHRQDNRISLPMDASSPDDVVSVTPVSPYCTLGVDGEYTDTDPGENRAQSSRLVY